MAARKSPTPKIIAKLRPVIRCKVKKHEVRWRRPHRRSTLMISQLFFPTFRFPDKEVGQFPMAYVVRKTGSSLSETAVMDFIAKQVAPYKRIRRVAFVASIPKNPSGKILRKDLIKLALSKM